jgi:hypothetical protein
MHAPVTHAWKLVAPWWRWPRQKAESPSLPPRSTRPTFQKFDHPDFVKSFVRDPQRSLKFLGNTDLTFKVDYQEITKPFSAFTFRNPLGVARKPQLVPEGLRKIYLEIHKRYYLVVCELHCDAPGFPTVTVDQACQAGFVVRRRSHSFPRGKKDLRQASDRLQDILRLQAQLAELEQSTPAKGWVAKKRANLVAAMVADGTFGPKRQELQQALANKRQELLAWTDENGIRAVLEGWKPTDHQNIGLWHPVDETPAQLEEAYFPLYPLFADPNIKGHSARKRTVYFGVVPTSSFDTDEHGQHRLDADSCYEIRCFVRRHKPECPRTDSVPDCHGELVWSEPTEPYKLAAHTDLLGTSQRPVTIQMPDLGELAAQAAAFPGRKLAPVRVVQPQSLNFAADSDGKVKPGPNGGVGPGQICFFAIPLITIVAFFVFKLFLPIVVFLFGLFFLLQLKLCIPPSLSISGGLSAQLKVIGDLKLSGSINLDVDLDGAVFPSGLGIPLSPAALKSGLKAAIIDDAPVALADSADTAKAELDDYKNSAMIGIGLELQEGKQASDEHKEDEVGLDLTGDLVYEEVVKLSEVVLV